MHRISYENSPGGRPPFPGESRLRTQVIVTKPTPIPFNQPQPLEVQRLAIVVPNNHIMTREPLACIRDSRTLLVNNNNFNKDHSQKPPFLKSDMNVSRPVSSVICMNPPTNQARLSRSDRTIDQRSSNIRSVSPSLPFQMTSQMLRSSSFDHSSKSVGSSRLDIQPFPSQHQYQTILQQDQRVIPSFPISQQTRTIQTINHSITCTAPAVHGNGYAFLVQPQTQIPEKKNLSESAIKLLATYQKSKDILFQQQQQEQSNSIQKQSTASQIGSLNQSPVTTIPKSKQGQKTQFTSIKQVVKTEGNCQIRQSAAPTPQGWHFPQDQCNQKNRDVTIEIIERTEQSQIDSEVQIRTQQENGSIIDCQTESISNNNNERQKVLGIDSYLDDRSMTDQDSLAQFGLKDEGRSEIEHPFSLEQSNQAENLESERVYVDDEEFNGQSGHDSSSSDSIRNLEESEKEQHEQEQQQQVNDIDYSVEGEMQQSDASISAISCENSNVQIDEYEYEVIPQLQQFEEKELQDGNLGQFKNTQTRESCLNQQEYYSSSRKSEQAKNSPTSFESSDILPITFNFDGFKRSFHPANNQQFPFKVKTSTHEIKQPNGSIEEDCQKYPLETSLKSDFRSIESNSTSLFQQQNELKREPKSEQLTQKPARTYRDAQTSPIKVINAHDASGIYSQKSFASFFPIYLIQENLNSFFSHTFEILKQHQQRESRENNQDSTYQESSQQYMKEQRRMQKAPFDSELGLESSRPSSSQFSRQEYYEQVELMYEESQLNQMEGEEDYIKKRNREIKEEIQKKRRAKKNGQDKTSRKPSSNDILPASSLDNSRIALSSKREINLSVESSRSLRMNQQDLSYISGTSSIQEQAIKKRDEILLQIQQIDQQIQSHNSKRKSDKRHDTSQTKSSTLSSGTTTHVVGAGSQKQNESSVIRRSGSNSEMDQQQQKSKQDGYIISNTNSMDNSYHQTSGRSNSKNVPRVIRNTISSASAATGFQLPSRDNYTKATSSQQELTKAEQNLLNRQFPPSKSKINRTPISSLTTTPQSSSASSNLIKLEPQTPISNWPPQREEPAKPASSGIAKQRTPVLDFTKKKEIPVKPNLPLSQRQHRKYEQNSEDIRENGKEVRNESSNNRVNLMQQSVKQSSEPLAIINLFEIQKTKKRESSTQNQREEFQLGHDKTRFNKQQQQQDDMIVGSNKPPKIIIGLNTNGKHINSPKKDKQYDPFFPLSIIPVTQELDLEAEHERRQQKKVAEATAFQATAQLSKIDQNNLPIKQGKQIGIKGGKYQIFFEQDIEDCQSLVGEVSPSKTGLACQFDSDFSPIH